MCCTEIKNRRGTSKVKQSECEGGSGGRTEEYRGGEEELGGGKGERSRRKEKTLRVGD
jgi:hypothetical protein